jgi:hypothetical protein
MRVLLYLNIEQYVRYQQSVHHRNQLNEIQNHEIISRYNDHLFRTKLDSMNIYRRKGFFDLFKRIFRTPVVREVHQVYKLDEINDHNQVPKYSNTIKIFVSLVLINLL